MVACALRTPPPRGGLFGRPRQVGCRQGRRARCGVRCGVWLTGSETPPTAGSVSADTRAAGRMRGGRRFGRCCRRMAGCAAGEAGPRPQPHGSVHLAPVTDRAKPTPLAATRSERARAAIMAAALGLLGEAGSKAMTDQSASAHAHARTARVAARPAWAWMYRSPPVARVDAFTARPLMRQRSSACRRARGEHAGSVVPAAAGGALGQISLFHMRNRAHLPFSSNVTVHRLAKVPSSL